MFPPRLRRALLPYGEVRLPALRGAARAAGSAPSAPGVRRRDGGGPSRPARQARRRPEERGDEPGADGAKRGDSLLGRRATDVRSFVSSPDRSPLPSSSCRPCSRPGRAIAMQRTRCCVARPARVLAARLTPPPPLSLSLTLPTQMLHSFSALSARTCHRLQNDPAFEAACKEVAVYRPPNRAAMSNGCFELKGPLFICLVCFPCLSLLIRFSCHFVFPTTISLKTSTGGMSARSFRSTRSRTSSACWRTTP